MKFCFTHLPEAKHNLVVPQMSVIIDRKDSFCLDGIKWKKSIIQTISWSFYHLCRYIERYMLM